MLNRLIILNSKVYGRASIKLDNCDSLQLVGPNNVGKSTLIYTLNFLFIIDGKKMTFSGNRSGDKETVHHYFPSPINSYIIFEIFKGSYYCIVLKRNSDSEVEYYRFDSEYKDDLFLKEQENGKKKILKFNELKENLITSGLTLHPIKTKSEVFNFVYQRGKLNNGVVWLEDSVVSDGLSNNFSKIYRYLINSKLITNKTLKDAIIIADNKDKEHIEFSHKSRKEIYDLLKINDEIKAINRIKKDYNEFKDIYNKYIALTNLVADLIYSFNQQFEPFLIELESKKINKDAEITNTKNELDEELNPEKQRLDRAIGGKEKDLEHIALQISNIQDQINEINSFDDINLLRQTLYNLDRERKSIETKINRIEVQKLSSQAINGKISERNDNIERYNKQIKNYASQLIHNLTDLQEEKEVLNFILSPDFSSLPSNLILAKISSLGNTMKLFDGEIKLPPGMGRKEIESIESLKGKLDELIKEKKELEDLLPVAIDFETAQEKLHFINTQIDESKARIRRTEEKPKLEKEIKGMNEQFRKIAEEKESLEKELKALDIEIARKSSFIQSLTSQKEKLQSQIGELVRWKNEVEEIPVEPNVNETKEVLEQIHAKISLNNKKREKVKSEKDIKFEKLKNKLNNTEADPSLFIKFVDEEIACLPDKEKSINRLLQAISTQFSNPANRLIRRYDEFKQFVNNKINNKLGKISISDIESLRIQLIDNKKTLDELNKIRSIEEFTSQMSMDFDRSENLKILNHYLDTGKEVLFDDLFDIELHLTRDGKSIKRDLKRQVESDGTDRMIRLVIIMLIINRLAINDKENKIAIFIDEIASIDGNNRKELFKFCKRHNFIPICASTDETLLDGFDKYYLLFRIAEGKQTNINENQNAMRQKVLNTHESN